MKRVQSIKYGLYDGVTPEGHFYDSAIQAKNAVVDQRYLTGKTYSIKKVTTYIDGEQVTSDLH